MLHSWLLHIYKNFGKIPSGLAAFDGLRLLNSLRICSLVLTKCIIYKWIAFYMIGRFTKVMFIEPVVKIISVIDILKSFFAFSAKDFSFFDS